MREGILAGGMTEFRRALSKALCQNLETLHRDACRLGYHETAHMIACARESLVEQIASEEVVPAVKK